MVALKCTAVVSTHHVCVDMYAYPRTAVCSHIHPLCSVETSMHVFTTYTHICSSRQCVLVQVQHGALLCVGIIMLQITVEANFEIC